MKKLIVVLILSVAFFKNSVAEDSLQIRTYVDKMKPYAIAEMHRRGVPASITLAQGILETNAGTSPLYSRSFNNFGIKCKSNWNGKFTYHDDDAKGECFRAYDNDSLSFVDHSEFLRTASRYDFLFTFEPTDYRSWAIGLKKAGYATNPVYSAKLIQYIEKYDLAKYDLEPSNFRMAKTKPASRNNNSNTAIASVTKPTETVSVAPRASESLNLPAPADTNGGGNNANTSVDPDNIKVVHWNVTNVPDATPGYTGAAAVQASPKHKYYKKAANKNISYGKKAVAKKPAAKGTTAVAKKTTAAPSKSAVAAKSTLAKKKVAPIAKPTASTASKNNRSTRK